MSQISVNDITSLDGKSGPVISGITTVSSTGYMMVPAGPTEYRGGRGRGVFFGGNNPTYFNEIQYITISTLGDAKDFGDMTRTHNNVSGAGSATRIVLAGGYDNSARLNTMDYITISSTGNAFDFGDLSKQGRSSMFPASDGTRGIYAGGFDPSETSVRVIEYITISAKGNSTNFGDLTGTSRSGASGCNSTRAVFMGGHNGSSNTNSIDYITMSTTGNSLDFGDATTAETSTNGITSNSVRAVRFAADYTPLTANTIDYVTIASLGDAIDFAESNVSSFNGGASCASPTRAVAAGGFDGGNRDQISYIEIMTGGTAQDFGNLIRVISGIGGASDSHGGLG
jgi:hypothetical protein